MITAMEMRPAEMPTDRPSITRAEAELACRGLPATEAQVAWARSRPAPRRTQVPQIGDEVLYRHDSWDTPVRATVTGVQPIDDIDDPHVMQPQTDGAGNVVLVEGRPVFVSNPDPWLLVHLTVDARQIPGVIGSFTVETREARLPGSPGWLPLDWADRWRPMPWEV